MTVAEVIKGLDEFILEGLREIEDGTPTRFPLIDSLAKVVIVH